MQNANWVDLWKSSERARSIHPALPRIVTCTHANTLYQTRVESTQLGRELYRRSTYVHKDRRLKSNPIIQRPRVNL